MEENLELLGNIVRSTINDQEFLENDKNFPWNEFSFVFSMDNENELTGNFGYVYDQDGNYCAGSVDPFALAEAVEAYHRWLSKDIDKGFIKMLIQFNRNSGRVAADFEYEDENRWQVTPNNVDQMIEELHPNLDG